MGPSISLAMAADESYAAPLFVTVASLVEHLDVSSSVDLYVLGGLLSRETQTRFERAWSDRLRVHWTPVDSAKLVSLRGYGHTASPAAWFRLLLGSSLPAHVSKVIYLDADLCIHRDVTELWLREMDGHIVLAVQDSYIQRYCASGRSGGTIQPYFNSGVMVIDLEAWRLARIEQQCLNAAAKLPHRLKWLDQQVLNACLVGRWGLLPPIWNRQFSVDLFPDWRCSPYDEADFEEARRNPAITHFCTRTKPWHPFCDHRSQDVVAYRAALRRAAPEGFDSPSPIELVVERLAAPHRRLLDTTAAAIHARSRKHAIQAMLPDILKVAVMNPWTLISVPLSIFREQVAMRLKPLKIAR